MIRLEPAVPEAALEAIRAPLRAFASTVVATPVLQPLARLLDFAGEAMRARLVVVESDAGEAMALRPDFTIAVAEQHIASGAPEGRYAYEGPAFQAGAADDPAEFLEMGVEAYGPDPDLDWQVLVAAWRAAEAGARRDLKVKIGGVGMFRALLKAVGASEVAQARLLRAQSDPRTLAVELDRTEAAPTSEPSRIAAMLAALPEPDAAAALEELWRLAGVQPVGGRGAAEIVHRLAQQGAERVTARLGPDQADIIRRYLAVSGAPEAAIKALRPFGREVGLEWWEDALDRWLDGLRRSGLPAGAVTLSTSFARAFGYYDGMMFEITSEAVGDGRPVAAGGRYDGLLTRLGAAQAQGAVGCMVRPWRAYAGGGA